MGDIMSIIIEIDRITSGKKNVISLYRNNKQINISPLLVRSSSDSSNYKYSHHFDKEDLLRLNKTFPSIYAKEDDKNIKEWIEHMSTAFKNLIESGKFDEYFNTGTGEKVKFIWINK